MRAKAAMGDSSPGLDPAAAPLGTDDEAGKVPANETVGRAEARRGNPTSEQNAPSPELPPGGGSKPIVSVPLLGWIATITLAAAAGVFAFWRS